MKTNRLVILEGSLTLLFAIVVTVLAAWAMCYSFIPSILVAMFLGCISGLRINRIIEDSIS